MLEQRVKSMFSHMSGNERGKLKRAYRDSYRNTAGKQHILGLMAQPLF